MESSDSTTNLKLNSLKIKNTVPNILLNMVSIFLKTTYFHFCLPGDIHP